RDPIAGLDVIYKYTYNDTYERTARIKNDVAHVHIDKSKWRAWFVVDPSDTNIIRPGDFILTQQVPYEDGFSALPAPGHPVGIVSKIGHDTIYLDNLAIGIKDSTYYLYVNYYV